MPSPDVAAVPRVDVERARADPEVDLRASLEVDQGARASPDVERARASPDVERARARVNVERVSPNPDVERVSPSQGVNLDASKA